jgi:hypothetical protein
MMQQDSALKNKKFFTIMKSLRSLFLISGISDCRKYHYRTIYEHYMLYQLAVHSFYFQFHVLLTCTLIKHGLLDRHSPLARLFLFSHFFFKHCTILLSPDNSTFISQCFFLQFRRTRDFRRWQWSVCIL